MKSYKPSAPRMALGVIAFALTSATFGLFVVGPAVLVAQSGYGAPEEAVARWVTTEVDGGSVRALPAVEVVARRSSISGADRYRVGQVSGSARNDS
jgi:hypothetical protein